MVVTAAVETFEVAFRVPLFLLLQMGNELLCPNITIYYFVEYHRVSFFLIIIGVVVTFAVSFIFCNTVVVVGIVFIVANVMWRWF